VPETQGAIRDVLIEEDRDTARHWSAEGDDTIAVLDGWEYVGTAVESGWDVE
jgi:hypothetical protein